MEARIAIFSDNKWDSEIPGFNPIKCQVLRPSRIIKAPVESGVLAADTKVLDPITIKMTGKADRVFTDIYGHTYNGQVDKYVVSKLAKLADVKSSDFISARCPDGFYNNLVIESVETNSETGEFDWVTCTVTLVEMLFMQGDSSSAMSPDNNSLSRTGFINS